MGFTVGDTVYIANTPYTVEDVSKKKNDKHPVKLRCNVNGCTHYVMIDGRLDEYDEIPSVTFKPQPMPDYGKPEWQPEPGQLVWAWYSSDKLPTLAKFHRMNANLYRCFNMSNFEVDYRHIAPFNGGKLPEEFKHLLKGGCE